MNEYCEDYRKPPAVRFLADIILLEKKKKLI